MINILILLLLWHALADFPLQGDFLARFKAPQLFWPRHAPAANGDYGWRPNGIWFPCMSAHCLIQAGGVYLITGWWVLFVTELVAHFAIDYAKCRNHISFGVDQVLHLGCKLAWLFLLVLR